jgi:hypothetical protein
MSALARHRAVRWLGKRFRLGCVLLFAVLIGVVGCGRNSKAEPPVALNGVSIDLPKLQQSCGSSDPTVRESVDKVRLSIRYADYRTALAELGKLATNPDLSETQKKTISSVSEQIKHAFANATPTSASSSVQ